MLVKRTRTYTQRVEGQVRNQFAETMRHAFNARARAHIQEGGNPVVMMEMDGSINKYKVKALKETHAVLENSDGETYGMVWEENNDQ